MFRFALSTQRHTIDYDVIMKNALRKRFWKTTWNLYDAYGIKVSMEVKTISPQREEIELRIKVTLDGTDYIGEDYNTDGYYWEDLDNLGTTSILDLSIKEEHYNSDVFKNGIKGSIKRSLNTLFSAAARMTVEYEEAKERDNELSAQKDRENNNYLDEKGITDEPIREAYIAQNSQFYNDNAVEFLGDYKLAEKERITNLVIDGVVFE